MAAVVDDYSGLTLHELKSQVQAVVTEIGVNRARELQAGQTPKPGIEVRYLKLFEAMKKHGLGAACLPSEPRVRVQQQQRPNMMLSPIVPYPVNVPRFAGNH